MINVDCLFQIVSHFLLLSTFWPHFILGQQKKDNLKVDSLLNGFNFFDPISFRADKKNYNLIVDSLLNGHLMVISGPFLHAKFLSSLFDSNLKLYFLKPHFDHWGWYWTPIFHFFCTGGIFEISTPDIPRFPEQGWYWTPIYHVFRTGVIHLIWWKWDTVLSFDINVPGFFSNFDIICPNHVPLLKRGSSDIWHENMICHH